MIKCVEPRTEASGCAGRFPRGGIGEGHTANIFDSSRT